MNQNTHFQQNMRPQSQVDTSERVWIDPLHYRQYSKVMAELIQPMPPAPAPVSLPVQETMEAVYKTLIRGDEMTESGN